MRYIQSNLIFYGFTISFHHSKEVFVCCLIVSLRCVFWVALSIRGGGIDSPRPASQRAAAFILTAAMLTTLTAPAFAKTWDIEKGDITVKAGETGNDVTQNNVTTKNDTNTIITNQKTDTASSHTVTIKTNDKNDTVEVTLKDVNIDASSRNEAAVSVTGSGNTTIKLDGDNHLTGGISDNGSYGLSGISSSGSLTISGGETDSLTAQGGSGTDGSGGRGIFSKDLTISGGTVNANGGDGKNGSGGSGITSLGSLTISGGTVNAAGGDGTNSSDGGDGGDGITNNRGVTISSGGTVTAKGGSGEDGSGGRGISSFGGVTISSGGTVTATGGDSTGSNGLGGRGICSDSGGITISGGSTVTANGGNGSSGRDGISSSSGVTVSDGTVTATGGNSTGSDGSGGDGISSTSTTISGGTVTADGGSGNFSGGNGIRSFDVAISGGTVNVAGGNGGNGSRSDVGNGIISNGIDLSGSLELTAKAGSPNGKALSRAGHELDLNTIKDKLGPGAKVTTTDADGKVNQVPIPGPVEPEEPVIPEESSSSSDGGSATPSAPASSLPGLTVTDKDGQRISYTSTQSGNTLTVCVGRFTASLRASLSTLRQLRAEGIDTITFQTILCSTTLSVDELLAMGGEDAEAVLTHRFTASSLTVG